MKRRSFFALPLAAPLLLDRKTKQKTKSRKPEPEIRWNPNIEKAKLSNNNALRDRQIHVDFEDLNIFVKR